MALTTVNKKLVAIGDGACGKTSLLVRFSKGEFPTDYEPTIFDSYVAQITLASTIVKLSLFDTAGQEDFDRLRPIAYQDVDVTLVCYDLTQKETLENCENKWKGELDYFMKNTPFILVGCKMDLRAEMGGYGDSIVSTEMGQETANKLGAMAFIETSAKKGDNVNELFEQAARLTVKSAQSSGCCVIC